MKGTTVPDYVLVPLLVLALLLSAAVPLAGALIALGRQRDGYTALGTIIATIIVWIVVFIVLIGLQVYGFGRHPSWWSAENGGMATADMIGAVLTVLCYIPLVDAMFREKL